MENGEKKDKVKKEEEASEVASEKERKPPKARHGLKKEEAPAFMASFCAGVEVYQTKMLVSRNPASTPTIVPY